MSYTINKKISAPSFEIAVENVTASLKEQGFGIITTIDMKATLKNKLDVDFKPYTILGACNPKFAHKAILAEEAIGAFLPCNVLVIESKVGEYNVVAVDPVASMMAVENEQLPNLASDIKSMLTEAIENIN